MTTHFSHFDDDAPTDAPADEQVSAEADSIQATPDEHDTPPDATTDELPRRDEPAPQAPRTRSRKTAAGAAARNRRRTRADGVIKLRQPADAAKELPENDYARDELREKGFTEDEAARIIDLSTRLGSSREAREAEASLRRLRFTRWLIQHGMLDEFSA
jgi:hypothetical protein